MLMNTEWIETFLTIVNCGSINLAAEALFLSQSTISTRLALLEEALGFSLLFRAKGRRNLMLTSEGIDFLPLAKHMIELKNDARDIRKKTRHHLRIGALDSLNFSVLMPVYKKILLNAPETRLMIRTSHSREVYDLLERQEIDLGFSSIELNRKNIRCQYLFKQPLYVIQYSNSPTNIQSISPQDLDPTKEICQHQEDSLLQWHNYWWKSGLQIRVDTTSLLDHFLSLPGYWAIVPYSTIHALSHPEQLQIYELTSPPPDRFCYIIESEREYTEESLTCFRELFLSFLHDENFLREYGLIPVK